MRKLQIIFVFILLWVGFNLIDFKENELLKNATGMCLFMAGFLMVVDFVRCAEELDKIRKKKLELEQEPLD
jgi:hypothetical protein